MTIMKYRKKPVVIEALQFNDSGDAVNFLGDAYLGITKCGGILIRNGETNHVVASLGDYIIKGVHGEFSTCKPDIFNATYEAVTTAQ